MLANGAKVPAFVAISKASAAEEPFLSTWTYISSGSDGHDGDVALVSKLVLDADADARVVGRRAIPIELATAGLHAEFDKH
jgi:hypothetical protein